MPIVLKSGNFNFLEPSGLVQACNGSALPLYIAYTSLQSQIRTHLLSAWCQSKLLPLKSFIYVYAVFNASLVGGRLSPNYKIMSLCTLKSKTRRVLKHHNSYFLIMSILYKPLQKLKLQRNIFSRLCILAWNCEHSECINSKCF